MKLYTYGLAVTIFKFYLQLLKVTPLGRAIADYPVLPRYGKMLALSHQHNLFEYMICIVAALSVQEVSIHIHKYVFNDRY